MLFVEQLAADTFVVCLGEIGLLYLRNPNSRKVSITSSWRMPVISEILLMDIFIISSLFFWVSSRPSAFIPLSLVSRSGGVVDNDEDSETNPELVSALL